MNDSEAVERLKKGEPGGLDALVLAYQEKAIRTATLITRDDELAKDAVQETFLRIYQRIRNYDVTRPFEPYLLRSVVNTALNLVEKQRRTLPFKVAFTLMDVESLIARASSTEDQVEYNQLKAQIAAGLDALPPRERAVIVERYYLGMSEKEMAETHKVAPGTVKWLLSVARKHLRAHIGTENE
jgi:RNA polymerase sigma-70 factor (ECF subfamily)